MSGRLKGPAAWLLFPLTAATMIFILAPLVVTIATSISNTQYIIFPPRGFTVEWYGKALQDSDFVRAKAGVEHNFGTFPRERMNPNGGSVALGHPFAATGARILSQAVKELAELPKGSPVPRV